MHRIIITDSQVPAFRAQSSLAEIELFDIHGFTVDSKEALDLVRGMDRMHTLGFHYDDQALLVVDSDKMKLQRALGRLNVLSPKAYTAVLAISDQQYVSTLKVLGDVLRKFSFRAVDLLKVDEQPRQPDSVTLPERKEGQPEGAGASEDPSDATSPDESEGAASEQEEPANAAPTASLDTGAAAAGAAAADKRSEKNAEAGAVPKHVRLWRYMKLKRFWIPVALIVASLSISKWGMPHEWSFFGGDGSSQTTEESSTVDERTPTPTASSGTPTSEPASLEASDEFASLRLSIPRSIDFDLKDARDQLVRAFANTGFDKGEKNGRYVFATTGGGVSFSEDVFLMGLEKAMTYPKIGNGKDGIETIARLLTIDAGPGQLREKGGLLAFAKKHSLVD